MGGLLLGCRRLHSSKRVKCGHLAETALIPPGLLHTHSPALIWPGAGENAALRPPPNPNLPARCGPAPSAGVWHPRLRAAVQRIHPPPAQAGAPGAAGARGGHLPPPHQHQLRGAAQADGGAAGGRRRRRGGRGGGRRGGQVGGCKDAKGKMGDGAVVAVAVSVSIPGLPGGSRCSACALGMELDALACVARRETWPVWARREPRVECQGQSLGLCAKDMATERAPLPARRLLERGRRYNEKLERAREVLHGGVDPSTGKPLFRPQTCRAPKFERNPAGAARLGGWRGCPAWSDWAAWGPAAAWLSPGARGQRCA